MSLVDCISRIVKANIQELLDRAEDPEKILKQLILELNENLKSVKIEVLSAIKEEKRLSQKYAECENLVKEWEEKTILALKNNNEDLAKEALKKKKDYELQRDTLKVELEKQSKNVKILKENLELLSEKIKDAETKKSILIARKKTAETKKLISETLSDIEGKLEEEVYLKEAEVELEDDILEKKFRELNGTEDIDNELKAYKEKMKN